VTQVTALLERASLKDALPTPIFRHTFNGASIVSRATPLLSLSLILIGACTARSAGFEPPPAVAVIEVSPAVATLAAGDSLDFSAVGYSVDGTPVSTTVAWASTGGVTSSNGLYHAGTTAGTYVVIANTGDLSVADTAVITITP
jgi:hypothetical protein